MELVRNRVSVGPELVELLRNYTPTSKHRKSEFWGSVPNWPADFNWA